MSQSKLIKIKDVSDELGLSLGSVYRLIKDKVLTAIRITPGGSKRVYRADLAAYLAKLNDSPQDAQAIANSLKTDRRIKQCAERFGISLQQHDSLSTQNSASSGSEHKLGRRKRGA